MRKLIVFVKVLIIGALFYSCGNDAIDIKPQDRVASNNDVSETEAIVIAKQFIEAQGLLSPETRGDTASLRVVYTDLKGASVRSSSATPSYYVINIGSSGYVVVSGSGATLPVLGYSTESAFDPKDIPSNMSAVLSDYAQEVSFVREGNIQPDEATIAARRSYLDGSAATKAPGSAVSPLLGTIKWNQNPYYNAYCPKGCPVGCVATATSQIMRYWEYPAKGVGNYSYQSTYGTLSFDYNYAINWSNMPKARLTSANKDIAMLCYGVAVGIKMNFSPSGSGAWQEDVPRLLTQHYKYPNTMKNEYRSNYTADQWSAILKKELSEGRPIQYAGYGNGGGHSFVCDGYDARGYFHFNWGWGGSSDGYFLLSALNPGSLGTGGGTGGFNYKQSIITGIQSPNGTQTDDYCVSRGNYARATFIKNVTVGNINNTTAGNAGGYNYFENQVLKIKSGDVMTISLTPGFLSGSYPENWRVWIDYNGNKIFEDNEMVVEGVTSATSPLVASFTVPTGLVGKTTRMRVSMKWGGYASSCEIFDHGEVEDYVVEITGAELKYCESKGLYSRSTFIQTVAIGNMTNTTQSNGGYAYFPNKIFTSSAGVSVGYKLTPGFAGQSYPEYWSVWIDYNRNGVFDSNEKVIEKASQYAVSGSFNIPSSLKKGLYRVRVSMKWGSYSTPCEIFDHGEVEDYNMEIR